MNQTLDGDGSPGGGSAPVRGKKAALVANRAVYWISRHWLLLVNLMIALFLGLAFAAPVLMHVGAELPAQVLYRVYSTNCHQMAFRSWYLFGEQTHYPLAVTGSPGVRYFEEYVRAYPGFADLDPTTDFSAYSWKARALQGDERMGYKVALCQRDVAIYAALLLGGMAFGLLRRWVRPLPWYWFVLVGILPMLADGGYQLVTRLAPWLEGHETTPLWRTLTGAAFGLGLMWMTYPHISTGMQETEWGLREKFVRAGLAKGSDSMHWDNARLPEEKWTG
jgi:uncharacterized membrane protein